MNAHYELAAMLLDRGADPERRRSGVDRVAPDRMDAPAQLRLQPARRGPNGRARCARPVRKLVQHGADVNARQTKEPRDGNRNMLNRIGATPFLLAAKAVDLPLMRTLLDVGADPSCRTSMARRR